VPNRKYCSMASLHQKSLPKKFSVRMHWNGRLEASDRSLFMHLCNAWASPTTSIPERSRIDGDSAASSSRVRSRKSGALRSSGIVNCSATMRCSLSRSVRIASVVSVTTSHLHSCFNDLLISFRRAGKAAVCAKEQRNYMGFIDMLWCLHSGTDQASFSQCSFPFPLPLSKSSYSIERF
jgi:hypothetical protein